MTRQRRAPQYEEVTPHYEQTEIPRHPIYKGPYVIPPKAKRTWGDAECGTCHRLVAPLIGKRGNPIKSRKHTCKCEYYKRCTTYIDVIQDEFLLKQWGKRNVAYGVATRPDLILAAASCRPDSDEMQTQEDKDLLNQVAREASEVAGHKAKALIGTSLHKLTHMIDRGEELGYVPEQWRDDIKAYVEATKNIKWAWVESFRVHDGLKVGGTVDRIGWYKGRFVVMDVKTGSDWNEAGFAMQLAMYGHSTPYNIGTDQRIEDPEPVDPNIGYVIKLPAGKGICKIEPIHIGSGWGAVKVATDVWRVRAQKYFMEEHQIVKGRTFLEMAATAGTIKECKLLWANSKTMGHLTPELKTALRDRVIELGGTVRSRNGS